MCDATSYKIQTTNLRRIEVKVDNSGRVTTRIFSVFESEQLAVFHNVGFAVYLTE